MSDSTDSVIKTLEEGGFDVVRLDKASTRDGSVWGCKVGIKPGTPVTLPGGADTPMRDAVETAFKAVTGLDAEFCFSGWGEELTPEELAVVEEDYRPVPPPEVQPPLTIIGYSGANAQPVTLILSDGSELEFNPDDYNSGS